MEEDNKKDKLFVFCDESCTRCERYTIIGGFSIHKQQFEEFIKDVEEINKKLENKKLLDYEIKFVTCKAQNRYDYYTSLLEKIFAKNININMLIIDKTQKHKLQYHLRNTLEFDRDKKINIKHLPFFTYYYLHLNFQFIHNKLENLNKQISCFLDKYDEGKNQNYLKIIKNNLQYKKINLHEIDSKKCIMICMADLLCGTIGKMINIPSDNKSNKKTKNEFKLKLIHFVQQKLEITDEDIQNCLQNANKSFLNKNNVHLWRWKPKGNNTEGERPPALSGNQMPPPFTHEDNTEQKNKVQVKISQPDEKPKPPVRKTNYEQLVEDIKARGISSVIERFCHLQNAGAGRKKARCPFHHEKTPSFYVDERKGFYKCFGCGESGDVFKFVEKIRSCDFLQSVDYLCDFFGIDKSKYVTQDEGNIKQQASFYKTMSVIADFYEQELKQNPDASLYVSGVRGLTDETIKKYKIGLANNDLGALQTYCEAHGIGEAELLDSGVVRKSEKDDEKYLFFRDRIMIPITNPSGKIVAFGGRIYKAADEANKVAKYLNSSENFYFKKGRILFNLYNAKQALTADKQFIIVEGYMDVIALAQAGINTGIAPLGTSITDEHLKLIISYCKQPIFVFDNDNAGHKASLRACEMMFPLLRSGIVPKFCMLEGAKDCDEYLKKYATEELQKQFDNAILIDEFLFIEKCKQYGIEQGKQANPNVLAQMQSDVMALIRRIPDEILKENYINIFKDKFWTLQHARSTMRVGYTNYKRPSMHNQNNVDTLEKNIVACLLNNRALLEDFDINENVICRFGEKNRELLNTLLEDKEENQAVFCSRYVTDEGIDGLVAKLKMAALNSSKLPEKVKANEKRKLIEERKKALKAFVEEEE